MDWLFFFLGSKIGEKVKLWFLSNHGGELSQMHRNEVSKVWLQKDLILVGFWLSQVGWIGYLSFAIKNWWKSEVMVLQQSWWGIVTNV